MDFDIFADTVSETKEELEKLTEAGYTLRELSKEPKSLEDLQSALDQISQGDFIAYAEPYAEPYVELPHYGFIYKDIAYFVKDEQFYRVKVKNHIKN